jgi:hypothetical protein
MKQNYIQHAVSLVSVLVALGLGFVWGHHEAPVSKGDQVVVADKKTAEDPTVLQPPKSRPQPPATFVAQAQWQELRNARTKALEDPTLAAEYKSILDDAKAAQRDFDSAMVKADPHVAPIVAKLVALRDRNSVSRSTLTH